MSLLTQLINILIHSALSVKLEYHEPLIERSPLSNNLSKSLSKNTN